MKKACLAIGGLVVCLICFAIGDSYAQVKLGLIRGGGHGGQLHEPEFNFRTVKDNKAVVNIQRQVLVIPEIYGELFAVTTADKLSILWFQDEKKAIRNVIVEDNTQLFVTDRQGGGVAGEKKARGKKEESLKKER